MRTWQGSDESGTALRPSAPTPWGVARCILAADSRDDVCFPPTHQIRQVFISLP